MFFCHFDEKNLKKLILSFTRRSFVFITALFFFVIGTGTTVSVTNMFEKAEYNKPIFQGLISRVVFDVETRGQVFCIALGPVTLCITIGTIRLLYLFKMQGDILNA